MLIKAQDGDVINSNFVKKYYWNGSYTCAILLGEERSTYLCRNTNLVDDILNALLKGDDYFVCVGGTLDVD